MKTIRHKKIKFLITEASGIHKEREGYSFHYTDPEWISQYVFILHKDPNEGWKVTEYSTGYKLQNGVGTKKEALNKSKEALIRAGEVKTQGIVHDLKMKSTYHKWKLEQGGQNETQ